MSKAIFTSSVNEKRKLRIYSTKNGVALIISDNETNNALSFTLAQPNTAGGALAILDAAGVVHHDPDDSPYDPAERTENMGALNEGAFLLARHVGQEAKRAHIAKEQAVLETEALELMNVRLEAAGISLRVTKETANPTALAEWITVARRAREIAGMAEL